MNQYRISQLREYVDQEPGDPFPKYALSLELLKISDENEAFELMQEIHQNHPEYLPVYYQYAKMLFTIGEDEKAVKIARQGVELAKSLSDTHAASELLQLIEFNKPD